MFFKCAALMLAALLQIATVQAEPFDPSAYQGERVFEVLATGDMTPILQADSESRNRFICYAMGVASQFPDLYAGTFAVDFAERAFITSLIAGQEMELDANGQDALMALGAQDARVFASHHTIDSPAALTLLANLSFLMEL